MFNIFQKLLILPLAFTNLFKILAKNNEKHWYLFHRFLEVAVTYYVVFIGHHNPRSDFKVAIHFDNLKGVSDFVAYWGAVTIHGHSVVPIPLNCDGRPRDVFTWATYITDFFSSFLKDIRNEKYDKAFKILKF